MRVNNTSNLIISPDGREIELGKDTCDNGNLVFFLRAVSSSHHRKTIVKEEESRRAPKILTLYREVIRRSDPSCNL